MIFLVFQSQIYFLNDIYFIMGSLTKVPSWIKYWNRSYLVPTPFPPPPTKSVLKMNIWFSSTFIFFLGEEVVLLLYIHDCRIPPRVLSSTQFNEFQHHANVEYHNVLLQRGSWMTLFIVRSLRTHPNYLSNYYFFWLLSKRS